MNYEKFTNKAELYDKYRPNYAPKFIDFLYKYAGFTDYSRIADIGAGTGILSEEFLKKGSTVICVEPNKRMLEQAKKRLQNYKNIIYINSTAENTNMDDSTIDFITVGQAFHWFDKNAFLKECKRILVEDGKVILAWNITDSKDIINRELNNLNMRMLPNYDGYNQRDTEDDSRYSDFFKNMESYTFDNDLSLDEEAFVGRCLSRSYTPNLIDNNYMKYISELLKIFDLRSEKGKVKIKNNTKCVLGRVK